MPFSTINSGPVGRGRLKPRLHGVSITCHFLCYKLIDLVDYYKAQVERLAGQDARATPTSGTSKEGAAWGESLPLLLLQKLH